MTGFSRPWNKYATAHAPYTLLPESPHSAFLVIQHKERPLHGPERGWSHRLLGRFHVTGVFWYRFHHWGMSILPSRLVGFVVLLFVCFFFVFLRKIRVALASNLEPVLGPCSWRERQRRIFVVMWNFAWCLSERYERYATKRQVCVETESFEHWQEVTRANTGFVMLTAHLGNYEVGSMLPASSETRTVHVVREREVDSEAQEFIENMIRAGSSAKYKTHFQGDDPTQGLELIAALRRGEIVAMQGDRPRTGSRNLETSLFGRPFSIAAGPAALARAAGVPILPCFVLRMGRRRYRLIFRAPIHPESTQNRAQDFVALAQRIGTEMEWAIRRAPYQWFCFRPVFA